MKGPIGEKTSGVAGTVPWIPISPHLSMFLAGSLPEPDVFLDPGFIGMGTDVKASFGDKAMERGEVLETE